MNDVLYDYRFFCFNGKPKYVYVDYGSGHSWHKRSIYDADWVLQDFTSHWPRIEKDIPKPANFDTMLDIAHRLSSEFAFVRVDLYEVCSTVYVGELTFCPGMGFQEFSRPEIDAQFGDLLKLPDKYILPPKKIFK